MAERYAHVVGQQGEELTLLRTAAKEAEEAREQNAALQQTGGWVLGCACARGMPYVCVRACLSLSLSPVVR